MVKVKSPLTDVEQLKQVKDDRIQESECKSPHLTWSSLISIRILHLLLPLPYTQLKMAIIVLLIRLFGIQTQELTPTEKAFYQLSHLLDSIYERFVCVKNVFHQSFEITTKIYTSNTFPRKVQMTSKQASTQDLSTYIATQNPIMLYINNVLMDFFVFYPQFFLKKWYMIVKSSCHCLLYLAISVSLIYLSSIQRMPKTHKLLNYKSLFFFCTNSDKN